MIPASQGICSRCGKLYRMTRKLLGWQLCPACLAAKEEGNRK